MLKGREVITRAPGIRPLADFPKRATTADILPKKNIIPGSRPVLVTSAEPNPGD